MSRILIFDLDNSGSVDVLLEGDSLWLTKQQLAELLDTDRTSISRHISNIIRTKELDGSTCAFFTQVRLEGKRQISREIEHYNLDMIISVAYRVNSRRGTQFRKWATVVLREYLVEGIVSNERRISRVSEGVSELRGALEIIRKLNLTREVSREMTGFSELILRYVSDLEEVSKGKQIEPNRNVATVLLDVEQALGVVASLKASLKAIGPFGEVEASVLSGLVKRAMKSGPEVARQAAELLYIVVRNRPFRDGNKRIAGILFLYHLEMNGYRSRNAGKLLFNASQLSGLTWLVAKVSQEEHSRVIGFVMNLVESA